MADEKLVKIGPWPQGIVNTVDETDVPDDALRAGDNVDLDVVGHATRRGGRTKRRTLSDGHSLTDVGGMLLLVDNGELQVQDIGDWSYRVLATGLAPDREASFTEAGGEVFWSNGVQKGRIKNGEATFWGIDEPAPALLSAVSGSLPAGRYQVALTFEAADGTESGARKAAQIQLLQTGGIALSGIQSNADAAWVNVYCSETNGKADDDLYYVGSVSNGTTSYVSESLASKSAPLDKLLLQNPPVGQVLATYNGTILIGKDNLLIVTEPLFYHLFDASVFIQAFPEPITMIAPLPDGFYISAGRTWWVSGADPMDWTRIEVDDAPATEGRPLVIPGRRLSVLEYDKMVPVWGSRNGPVAGLPGGFVKHLTEGRVAMDGYDRAAMLHRREGSLSQLLMSLRQKGLSTRYGASDRATIKVTRGGVEI